LSLGELMDRGGNASVRREEHFTDRFEQDRAFRASIQAVRAALSEPDPLAPTGPRWNVLAFHGMGGVGKSSLVKEFRRRFDEGLYSPPKSVMGSVVVGFEGGRSRSLEEILLTLRAELAELGPWQAFDLAFAAYWEARHPGVSLASIPDHHTRLKHAGEIVGVAEEIQKAVQDTLSATPLAGAMTRVGGVAIRQVLGRMKERRLLEDCPFFGEIVAKENPDEMLAFMPYLLAWDLHQIQKGRIAHGNAADVVVFLDTWEELQTGTSATGSVEDSIVQMIFLMPNVLFVVLGRAALDWAGEHRRGTLRMCGPERWPGLAEGANREPRQHLLDLLERKDCEAVLAACRKLDDGSPAMPQPLREAIAAASQGLPYFLEVAADYFDTLHRKGIEPTPERFQVPFSQLVNRVATDLPAVERNLLCAASVAGSFGPDLISRLVPQALKSDVERFVQRDFVRKETAGWLSCRLHDRMREAVVHYRNPTGDTWSDEHWAEARVTAAEWIVDSALSRAANGAVGAGTADWARALILVAPLVRESASVPRQLPLLLWRVQQTGALPALLEVEGRLAGSEDPSVSALRVACSAALRSLRPNDPIAPPDVEAAFRSAPTQELRDVLALFLGDMRDVAADIAGAEAAFRSVSKATPEFSLEATRLEASVLHRRSRFKDAMELCLTLPAVEPADRVANESLRGRILYWSARFEDASSAFDASIEAAEQVGLRLWAARSARHKYLVRAWGALGEDEELGQRAAALNESVGVDRGLAQVEAARAINLTRAGEVDEGARLLKMAIGRLEARQAIGTWLMVLAAKSACAMLAGDRAGARVAHEELLAKWRAVDTGALWPVVSATLSGSSLDGLPEPQWLEGSRREDWLAVLRRG
jgi:tetratricopeptide (TPR) repeat protein